VSLYWFTRMSGLSANIYYEVRHAQTAPRRCRPRSRTPPPQRGLDFEIGGHFAALETPDVVVRDVRDFLRT
jgi:epoxide hydrolase